MGNGDKVNRGEVLRLINDKIESLERALRGGREVTLDSDTATGGWKQLRALVEGLPAE